MHRTVYTVQYSTSVKNDVFKQDGNRGQANPGRMSKEVDCQNLYLQERAATIARNNAELERIGLRAAIDVAGYLNQKKPVRTVKTAAIPAVKTRFQPARGENVREDIHVRSPIGTTIRPVLPVPLAQGVTSENTTTHMSSGTMTHDDKRIEAWMDEFKRIEVCVV